MLSRLLRPPRLRTTTLEEGEASDPRYARMELLSLAHNQDLRLRRSLSASSLHTQQPPSLYRARCLSGSSVSSHRLL